MMAGLVVVARRFCARERMGTLSPTRFARSPCGISERVKLALGARPCLK